MIAPALARWVREAPDAETRRARRERADITFGLRGAAFDPVRVLERYELLYEAGLVGEAWRDREEAAEGALPPLGEPMALDHRRLLATALGRLRGKLKYRPVVFELLPATFTLLRLQRVVEALAGAPPPQAELPAPRREGRPRGGHGRRRAGTVGRPAELFRFRREVLARAPRAGSGPAPRPAGPSADRRRALDFYAHVSILEVQGQLAALLFDPYYAQTEHNRAQGGRR